MNTNVDHDMMCNEESLYRLAFYDPLTGLPNRANLIDHFRRALMGSARDGTYGALMFCDLDKFKLVNDYHGHQTGDLLLRAAAQRLEQCVREVDLVARHGGDEFIVLIPPKHLSRDETGLHAEAVAAKIVASLASPYVLGRYTHTGSVSVGIVIFNGSVDTVESSFHCADTAMYQAKMSGRNRFRFFDNAMQKAMLSRSELDRAMAIAIENDQFLLHYQPQIDVRGNVTGAEALLRWRLTSGVISHPHEFIVAAEESGLIVEIGTWVIRCACAQLAFWQGSKETSHLKLSVNISPRQFMRSDLTRRVADILQQTGVESKALTFEVDERLYLSDPAYFIKQIQQLNALGVSFALADVGANGVSILRRLKGLPVNQLKISKSLTNRATGCSIDSIIVRAIVEAADVLGMSIVGEGIEDQAQQEFLEGVGCIGFQGHFFKPALTAAEFIRYALDNTAPASGMIGRNGATTQQGETLTL